MLLYLSSIICLLQFFTFVGRGGSLFIAIICLFNYLFIWGGLLGNSSKGPKKHYSIKGDAESQLFGIFNAIAIIATSYGNGIIPEIQVCIIVLFIELGGLEINSLAVMWGGVGRT